MPATREKAGQKCSPSWVGKRSTTILIKRLLNTSPIVQEKCLGYGDDDHLTERCLPTGLGFNTGELAKKHVDDATFVGAKIGKNDLLLETN